MKITIEFRNPTPAHCDVVVFVNGANTGVLRLRQDEVVGFSQILSLGCRGEMDSFVGRGNPNPESDPPSDLATR